LEANIQANITGAPSFREPEKRRGLRLGLNLHGIP
jgi:hypothetical protein